MSTMRMRDRIDHQRAEFILQQLGAGRVVRRHLMEEFGMSEPNATATFRRFMDTHPGAMKYDVMSKGYIPAEKFQDYRPVTQQ